MQLALLHLPLHFVITVHFCLFVALKLGESTTTTATLKVEVFIVDSGHNHEKMVHIFSKIHMRSIISRFTFSLGKAMESNGSIGQLGLLD